MRPDSQGGCGGIDSLELKGFWIQRELQDIGNQIGGPINGAVINLGVERNEALDKSPRLFPDLPFPMIILMFVCSLNS